MSIADAAPLLNLSEDEVLRRIQQGVFKGTAVPADAGITPRVIFQSIDFVHSEVKARQDEEAQQISTLDTKASFILGSASLIIGSVTAFQGIFTNHTIPHTICVPSQSACITVTVAGIARLPEVVIGALYVGIVYCALRAYGIRTYKTLNPPQMQQYLAHPEHDTKVAFIRAMVDAHTIDLVQIDDKVRWTQRAVSLFVVAGAALLSLIILSVVY